MNIKQKLVEEENAIHHLQLSTDNKDMKFAFEICRMRIIDLLDDLKIELAEEVNVSNND